MKKVITYGTYDLFHKGHYNILKKAKEAGDYLIVGVTGETYDIGRGKLSVHDSLATRIENVKATGLADEIIVEEYLGQKIGDMVKNDIDVFVIGEDWKGKFDHLSRYCDIIYLERTKGVSSTQLREENFDIYDIGIITDILDDNQIIKDSQEITSFQVTSVYAEDKKLAKEFKKKYKVKKIYDSVDDIIKNNDIIYVYCNIEKRENLVRQALNAGKHVICETPFTLSKKSEKELFALAKKHNVILMENIKMVHIYIFNQLLWITQGGLIGDIVSFNCSISRTDDRRENIFYDLLALALCPMIKILGDGYKDVNIITKEIDNEIEFASLDFKYPNCRAVINVGNKTRVKNQIEIIGTEGTIRLYENWWRCKSFEIDKPGQDDTDKYTTNYQGNGYKYLLKAIATMLGMGKSDSIGLFTDESIAIAEILEKVEKNTKHLSEK